jgi:hypothetical protein
MIPGDFFGPYRVLAEKSRLSSSVTYLAEHPDRGSAAPVFLVVWPDLHLRSPEEEQAFAQACEQINAADGGAFQLLSSGVIQETPYLVLAPQEASQEQIALIDRRMQSSSSPTDSAEFLRALRGTSAPREAAGTGPAGRPGVMRRRVPRRAWAGAIAALVVVLACAGCLHVTEPASGATVILTPKSKLVQQTLSVVVFTRPTQNGDLRGRAITYTSPAQTQTGKATGKVHHDASTASGEVVISRIQLNGVSSEDVGSSRLTSNSGVDLLLDSFTATQGGTVVVQAHAAQDGASGDIGAYDIDFPINICSPYDLLCQFPDGTAYAQNTKAFTGGQDAYDETVVQQSDIDGLARPLISKMAASAQEQLSQLVAEQVQPGEHTVLPTSQCTPNVKPDHAVGAGATLLTVSVSVTCYQIAYSQQDFLPGVIHAEGLQVGQQYGPAYTLAGDLIADSPVYESTDASQQTATIAVKARSIWAYQVDAGHKSSIAQEILGKTQDDARDLVLSNEKDIQDVRFALQGFGGKLPTDANAIQFAVQPVSGLHA